MFGHKTAALQHMPVVQQRRREAAHQSIAGAPEQASMPANLPELVTARRCDPCLLDREAQLLTQHFPAPASIVKACSESQVSQLQPARLA